MFLSLAADRPGWLPQSPRDEKGFRSCWRMAQRRQLISLAAKE